MPTFCALYYLQFYKQIKQNKIEKKSNEAAVMRDQATGISVSNVH